MIMDVCRPRDFLDRTMDRYVRLFPCLSDPARRSSSGLKVALVMLHLVYVGLLFAFDRHLIEEAETKPWYTASYLLLVVATLIQYFLTSCSSPGYVLDAMRASNEKDIAFRKASKQPASSKNVDVVVTIDRNQVGKNVQGDLTSWTKMVMDMYPPGTSPRNFTCSYCHVEQPPRTKHCHDCDRCVLQFDHHCVWLGTCIGQGNHCRFWWYIFEETTLCLWTGILFISYLKADIVRAWWNAAIVIMLLITLSIALIFLLLLLLFHSYLVLTNQTTYELVRRRRIFYLRGIPERVFPFSKGVCHNLYDFCCHRSVYQLEPLPSVQELEERSRPYTCSDLLRCRCC
ncbi:protein S-acyltransferase 10-like [Cucurbita moschata]|uniref:S-acyltransferase n=1 Tax=Cucurbita moschata TaxID=3662 RepID=A0A6J1EGQ5_CUCMO|nr:protein S-acyltransferase 10-like [Cucurbita moschata]